MRGYDLANISFIKGDTGWIVFDPLTAQETARAEFEFISEKLRQAPGRWGRILALGTSTTLVGCAA